MSLLQIEIPRRARSCAHGAEELVSGAVYFSLLEYEEGGNCLRRDFCAACWEKKSFTTPSSIFWRSQVPLKPAVPETTLQRNLRALELLKEYYQNPEEEAQAKAFVLALLLARSRCLQLRQEVRQQEEVFLLYEVRESEEMLCIKRVLLSLEQAERVKTALSKELS